MFKPIIEIWAVQVGERGVPGETLLVFDREQEARTFARGLVTPEKIHIWRVC